MKYPRAFPEHAQIMASSAANGKISQFFATKNHHTRIMIFIPGSTAPIKGNDSAIAVMSRML